MNDWTFLHNQHHRSDCKPGAIYALQKGDQWCLTTEPLRLTPDPALARTFVGQYLNETIWDWSMEFKAVDFAQLQKQIKQAKEAHAKALKASKGKKVVAVMALLCCLSAFAGQPWRPVAKPRSAPQRVIIRSYRPLAMVRPIARPVLRQYQPSTSNQPKPIYGAIKAKPIQYRPLPGAK